MIRYHRLRLKGFFLITKQGGCAQACVFVGSAAQVSDVIHGPLCRFVYFVSTKLNTPDTAITELLATCR